MKTVIVTGASRGIGRAVAEKLGKAGWTVIVNYRTHQKAAEEVVSEIRNAGGEAYLFACDVADREAVRKMVDFALSLHGSVDALINNAAISEVGLFHEIPIEREKRLFDVNLFGVLNTTRAVLPHMISRKAGKIVNIASMWGEVGASTEVAYSTAKAAVIGFTKALADEVAPSGIAVNAVSPGVIDTEMNAHLSDDDRRALADEIPMGRFGTPDEIADCVAFLLEAPYVTGQILGANGGLIR